MGEFFKNVWQMILDSNLLSVLGALAILLIGWLIALVVSRKVTKAVQTFTAKRESADGVVILQTNNSAGTIVGKVVYYAIFIIAILGCFSVLELNAAAAPIQDFVSSIAKYAPNIAGALLLAVVAWIIAGITRTLTRAAILRSKLSERLAAQIGASEPESVADYTAKTVYYIVFLFFLPAILDALKIYGITEPLQSMFEKILTFVPNLIAGGAILLIGLWVAGIVRRAVSGLVVISRLNAFGEKLGISKAFGNSGLSSMAGIVAYVLVAIPVVISALTALQIKVLSDSVASLFNKMLDATGDVIGAAMIIFVAVLVGSFAASLVTQLTANFGLDNFVAGMGFKAAEGKETKAPSVVVGKLAYLAILVMAILAACDVLEFDRLSEIVRSFAAFGGNVLLSIIVLLIGIWLANFVADAVKGKCGDLVVAGVRIAVIIFTIALAVSNLDIGGSIVEIAFTLILGAACVASAIAFGVGGKDAAAKLLNSWADKLKK